MIMKLFGSVICIHKSIKIKHCQICGFETLNFEDNSLNIKPPNVSNTMRA